MPVERLKRYLNEHGTKYLVIQHSPAYTAQEIAEATHIPGRHFAKSVVIRLDRELVLLAIPAPAQVPLERVAEQFGAGTAALASENEIRQHFPGCDVGAIPPFGHLFGMETYLSETLTGGSEIAFNAGSITEVMLLARDDFLRLAQPRVLTLGV